MGVVAAPAFQLAREARPRFLSLAACFSRRRDGTCEKSGFQFREGKAG